MSQRVRKRCGIHPFVEFFLRMRVSQKSRKGIIPTTIGNAQYLHPHSKAIDPGYRQLGDPVLWVLN